MGGVTWHIHTKKWHVQVYSKGKKKKYGGYFKNELDAAKRANQLCEELGIPPQNPTINAIPEQQFQDGDYKTIENLLISSEIVKPGNDDAKKRKRNCKKEFNEDD